MECRDRARPAVDDAGDLRCHGQAPLVAEANLIAIIDIPVSSITRVMYEFLHVFGRTQAPRPEATRLKTHHRRSSFAPGFTAPKRSTR